MENFYNENKKSIKVFITVLVSLVLVLILLIISCDTVEPTEYALKYNSISRKPDYTKVYSGGWYIVGPFSKFLTFPATQVNVDFADYTNAQSAAITTTVEQSTVTLSFSF